MPSNEQSRQQPPSPLIHHTMPRVALYQSFTFEHSVMASISPTPLMSQSSPLLAWHSGHNLASVNSSSMARLTHSNMLHTQISSLGSLPAIDVMGKFGPHTPNQSQKEIGSFSQTLVAPAANSLASSCTFGPVPQFLPTALFLHLKLSMDTTHPCAKNGSSHAAMPFGPLLLFPLYKGTHSELVPQLTCYSWVLTHTLSRFKAASHQVCSSCTGGTVKKSYLCSLASLFNPDCQY